MNLSIRTALLGLLSICACINATKAFAEQPKQYSGIYPHLAYFNNEGECGTGAVVPWADRLWVITYAPHKPMGSSDKLYEFTPDLKQIVRPESIGGTPANRMIHKETQQLLIGPYLIDQQRNVRTFTPQMMPGRLTGVARHLKDPENRVYYATMEEGLYDVDLNTMQVTELIKDGNRQPAIGNGLASKLPGYHGKGLYSSQGLLVYANNGEHGAKAQSDPFTESGALAGWNGSGDWQLIRRNQFTEVTGPGGIYGNENPSTDPIWTLGWDGKSLLLMMYESQQWHTFRLPKASHSYDGAHGWNTEWPRIREIGEDHLLMTMHGMFWKFPITFSSHNTAGITPRSTYLKVVGDFCQWNGHVVLGCDDTAHSEFLNKRKAKGEIKAPQSQSNLWFLKPEQLDQLGPAIGRGAVWLNESVEADAVSDPFLINGFAQRGLHLVSEEPATLNLEIDAQGNGNWKSWKTVHVSGYQWLELPTDLQAIWLRVRSQTKLSSVTAQFYMHSENRSIKNNATPPLFAELASVDSQQVTGGLVRARDKNTRTLAYAASNEKGPIGHYILDAQMNLKADHSQQNFDWLQKNAAVPSPEGVIERDAASVIYTSDEGTRFRLPYNPQYKQASPLGHSRLCREVATERDLFNCYGTFFELPARNAAGFHRVRPVASHSLQIKDFCSYRGLLVLSGIDLTQAKASQSEHIILSDDQKTALWVGAIDDLWSLGKPVGIGGPWKQTAIDAGEISDLYLMTGYDRKQIELSSTKPTTITIQVDLTGVGEWQDYKSYTLNAGEKVTDHFPKAFQAYWLRCQSSNKTDATVQLTYN